MQTGEAKALRTTPRISAGSKRSPRLCSMRSQRPQETSSPLSGSSSGVAASAAATSRSAPSKPGRTRREETCGHTDRRSRSRDGVRPLDPPRMPSGRWSEGATAGRAAPSTSRVPPVPPPRPPGSSSAPTRLPQPDATASRPDPTRVAAAAAGLTILSRGSVQSPRTPPPSSSGSSVDPPTSSATNKTRSWRETLLRGPVGVISRQGKKKKKTKNRRCEKSLVGGAR